MSPVLETTGFWETISLRQTKGVFLKQSDTRVFRFVPELKEATYNMKNKLTKQLPKGFPFYFFCLIEVFSIFDKGIGPLEEKMN